MPDLRYTFRGLCVLLTLSLSSAGCFYVSGIDVYPDRSRSSQLDDSEVLKIVASVSEVARSFGLTTGSDLQFVDGLRTQFGEDAAEGYLARFHTPRGHPSPTSIYVSKDPQNTRVDIMIRSWQETEETAFGRTLREVLTKKLVDEFGPDRIQVVRRSSDMPPP